MVNPVRIRSLPLEEFRKDLLSCHECFEPDGRCAHHEDVVGGYKSDKIVFVGLNPQAPAGHRVYSSIQAATWEQKRTLSDRLFEVYNGSISPRTISPAWNWTRDEHPGITKWLPMLCETIGITHQELSEHVLLLETFKHATANKGALQGLPQWKKIEATCPVWAHEQLARLKPRLLVLCGDDARLRVAPHLFERTAYDSKIGNRKITKLHGTEWRAPHTKEGTHILFTIGVASSSRGWWSQDPSGTANVRAAIRAALVT